MQEDISIQVLIVVVIKVMVVVVIRKSSRTSRKNMLSMEEGVN